MHREPGEPWVSRGAVSLGLSCAEPNQSTSCEKCLNTLALPLMLSANLLVRPVARGIRSFSLQHRSDGTHNAWPDSLRTNSTSATNDIGLLLADSFVVATCELGGIIRDGLIANAPECRSAFGSPTGPRCGRASGATGRSSSRDPHDYRGHSPTAVASQILGPILGPDLDPCVVTDQRITATYPMASSRDDKRVPAPRVLVAWITFFWGYCGCPLG